MRGPEALRGHRVLQIRSHVSHDGNALADLDLLLLPDGDAEPPRAACPIDEPAWM